VGGRQLDRERQPVDASADLDNGRRRAESGSNRTSAFDEEHFSVVVGQRLDRVALLELQVQRFAARDEHLRARGGGEQRRNRGRGLDYLLEVIEKDEQRLVRDVFEQRFIRSDGGCYRACD
jgi:hypothetical protein